MPFEFDERKSQANKQKHGINFTEAQQLWADLDGVGIRARTRDEPRFLLIGRIKGKLWSAIFTIRSGNVLIISVRRSRTSEVRLYESKGF